MAQYNGWTNYATWRINLEIFDGSSLRDLSMHRLDMWELKSALKEYAHETIEHDCKNDLTLSYARAFLEDVDWHEIAQHLQSDEDEDQNEMEIENA